MANDTQDMKTTVRVTMKTMFVRALLLILLMIGVGNEAWADVKFIIINNKGKAAFNYTINTSTLAVDPKAQSIYAENFRFYTSAGDAVADAGGYGLGTTIGSGTGGFTGPFYVRYDAKNTRVGSDVSKKYLIRVRNCNGIWWYIYFDKDDGNKLKMTNLLDSEATGNIDRYLWQFNDGGDPYDVYITSDYADEKVSGGTVSVAGVSTSNKTPYVTYQAKIADASYNQSATNNFTMQSFFFTKATNASTFKYNNNWSIIWSNSVHLVGAYNGISYNYRDGYVNGATFEETMPYYSEF